MKLNLENYKEALQGISVIEVSGSSCANCYSLASVLNQVTKNRSDCILHHLEITLETSVLAQRWNIESVPTVLIFYNEIEWARCRGYQPLEILELWLDAKIEEIKEKFGNK